MIVESICIILILSIMIFIYIRKKRKDYALSIVPLLIVPFVHTAVSLTFDLFNFTLTTNIKVVAEILALAVAVAFMGFIAGTHRSKKSRIAYLIMSGGFTALLTIIFICNYYS